MPEKNFNMIGIDNSQAMIDQCLKHDTSGNDKVQYLCQSLQDVDLEPSSLIFSHFLLQFIPYEDKEKILKKIYKALLPQGVLIISEKIIPSSSDLDIFHDLFRIEQGYSAQEIKNKRAALQSILFLQTQNDFQKLLKKCGFLSITPWYQCLNFTSFLVKTKI